MSGFFTGEKGVRRDLALGKLTHTVQSGQLRDLNENATTWVNLFVWPSSKQTGIGSELGNPIDETTITLWRIGEIVAPKLNWTIVASNIVYNIVSVGPLMNEDESSNYAIYECQCTKLPIG